MDNKKRLTQMLSFIAATLGIVCIACFFFPFLSITKESGSQGFYTGLEVCLGYGDNIVKMGMNILLVINLVLFLVTALLTLAKYQNKVVNLVAFILFFITALLTLLLPVYAKSLGNMFIGETDVLGLGWGAIICGIVSLIAAVLNLATLIFNKKLENEPATLDEKENETYAENNTADANKDTNTDNNKTDEGLNNN